MKNTLIWKVTPEGSPHSSYLLGTMHVRDAKAFVRLDDMCHCIDDCEVFATEYDMTEANQSLTAEHLALSEGESLEGLLGKKRFKKINAIIQKVFGMDLSFFNWNIPLMAVNVITGKILSDDMHSSLDESLSIYAREQGKVMIGIETIEEQMTILDNYPMDMQLKQLRELAKKPDKFRKQILHVAELFAQEEIQTLYKVTKKGLGKMRAMMLYDRNKNMAERFGKIAEEQSLCFAVGAAHLPGKKGLLKLLKNDGFSIAPVGRSITN